MSSEVPPAATAEPLTTDKPHAAAAVSTTDIAGLDNKGLGRLRRVADPRDVWGSESGDFTPWLADNLDVLADELQMPLTLKATEVSVGDFRLDIQAETLDGRVVVIENQLERTDHGHMGQLLVYASGLEAAAVVWVAPRFRDEFRRTLDWLNERTDSGVDFFGVEVGVVQIGSSGPRAPVFEVVARPNNWQKDVKEKSGAGGLAGSGVTPLNALRQDVFAEVLTEVVAKRPGIRMPARAKLFWLAFASGPFGNWDISAASDGRYRVEAYVDSGDQSINKELFDEFHAEASSWQEKAGVPLEWERLDDKRASRIITYHSPVDLGDDVQCGGLKNWGVTAILGLYDAMNDPLRQRAKQLRENAKSQSAEKDSGVGVAEGIGAVEDSGPGGELP